MKPSEEKKIYFDVSLDDMQYVYPCPQFILKTEGLTDEPLETLIDARIKHFETILCRKTATPVKIDGLLDDPVWMNDTSSSTFRTPDTVSKTKFPTQVRTAYNEENIYIAFRCNEPNMTGLVTRGKFRDSAIWVDDSVEILLDTNLDAKTFYHFIFNANALVYDARNFDSTWDAEYTAKAVQEPNAWTLEVAISWKSIGLSPPKPGNKIGVQFSRSRAQKPSELTQWSPTYNGLNRTPTEFGTLIIEN